MGYQDCRGIEIVGLFRLSCGGYQIMGMDRILWGPEDPDCGGFHILGERA